MKNTIIWSGNMFLANENNQYIFHVGKKFVSLVVLILVLQPQVGVVKVIVVVKVVEVVKIVKVVTW